MIEMIKLVWSIRQNMLTRPEEWVRPPLEQQVSAGREYFDPTTTWLNMTTGVGYSYSKSSIMIFITNEHNYLQMKDALLLKNKIVMEIMDHSANRLMDIKKEEHQKKFANKLFKKLNYWDKL